MSKLSYIYIMYSQAERISELTAPNTVSTRTPESSPAGAGVSEGHRNLTNGENIFTFPPVTDKTKECSIHCLCHSAVSCDVTGTDPGADGPERFPHGEAKSRGEQEEKTCWKLSGTFTRVLMSAESHLKKRRLSPAWPPPSLFLLSLWAHVRFKFLRCFQSYKPLTFKNKHVFSFCLTRCHPHRSLQKDTHTLYLEQELESLKVVLDIKNKQLHQQEKKLMEVDKLVRAGFKMNTHEQEHTHIYVHIYICLVCLFFFYQMEKSVKLDENLTKVQQENEDLKARMERHAALSRWETELKKKSSV